MVDIDLHRAKLVETLRAIYADPILRNVLGFKGGTAAMLFYGLPRMSVDLDFDLLDPEKKQEVFTRLTKLLPSIGVVSEATEKYFTLFFLISYQKGERGLKIEISKRSSGSSFTPLPYLGISMLVMVKQDMMANKLAALLTRKRFASRDVYDVWYFFKNLWPINDLLVKEKTGMILTKALQKAGKTVEGVKKVDILSGLGELLDNRQKNWAREHLVKDAIFALRLYRESLPKEST